MHLKQLSFLLVYKPCKKTEPPSERPNNPTIKEVFDWWLGQTQLKGLQWLITSSPVTARQSAAPRHSKTPQTTSLSPQTSFTFALGFWFLWSSFQVCFIFFRCWQFSVNPKCFNQQQIKESCLSVILCLGRPLGQSLYLSELSWSSPTVSPDFVWGCTWQCQTWKWLWF